MKEMLTKTKQNEAENVKIQFAELQNRFLDEIKALNDEQKQIKVRGDEALNKLKKEKSALKTKIDILEASIHEENRSNINKISNFKLKQLNQAKLLEEKESQIESLKKERKELKMKVNSHRRINKTL